MNHQSSNNQQQQQQSKSVGIVSEKASDSYLQQQQQQQQKPRVSNQNISIISLSKLKNYMPQSQLAAAAAAARLFPTSSQQARRQTHSLAAGYRSDLAAPDQSSLYLADFNHNHHETLASVRALSLTSQLNLHNCARSSAARSAQPASAFRTVNQGGGAAAQAQQANRQEQQQQQPNKSGQSSSSAIWKGAELDQAVRQDRHLLSGGGVEERKRNRINLQVADREEGSTAREEENERRSRDAEHCASSYSKNNMTPSSLLLLQNHNYIEQRQQQPHQQLTRNIALHYDTHSTTDHQKQGDQQGTSGGQLRIADITTTTATTTVAAAAEACDAKKGDVNQPQLSTSISSLPLFNSSSSSSVSSSSLMLTNINQFKVLDSIGNPSIVSGPANSNTSATSSSNIVNSSDYLANQDLNQVHNQLSDVDLAGASLNNINSLQHSYQQSLASSHFKDTACAAEAQQFVNYSINNSNSTRQINHYHQNFQASMLSQQIKLDNVAANQRNVFEENNPNAANNQALQMGANPNAESMSIARNIARQQTRTNIDQYYNNHYSLMPPVSSKSSSPASSTSTPSPKINSMHSNPSQHSSQIISSACANPSSTQTLHLGHMNNHYANASIAEAGGLNQQQQIQVNQDYPYNTQATNGPSQQHLPISNHEQAYAHQQQQQLPHSHHQEQQIQQHQQHHHHQQQQQHHQQQQQQQQHQHQQHHHQQAIPHQQSIYHHLANNSASMNVNHIYGNSGSNAHYQGHLQASSGNHQTTNHLMQGAHQNHHLNSAAAACAAAAVVSQTLKTVAHQHSQQHQYGGSITSGFNSTGNLMNMAAQHQQFHSVNQINNHQLGNPIASNQHQQQQNLPVHHAASMVTRKYECKMCPQVFMSKAEMKYHNQNHMREAKPYKCLQCPKAFANSSYLSQHMRIHQGVKPYTCDICARKFTQLSHLQQHKRTHTGDKPYKCNYMNCTKQFSQLSNLQSHSRCHQLDKPYKCNSCYKCFHDEQSLLEHIPRHLESKHLKKNLCIFCGSSYQQERGLVKHFQQYHTDKKPTLVAAAIAAGTTGNSNLIASIVSSAAPNVNGSSSSSSISSVSSSGSVNVHNNLTIVNVAQGASGGKFEYVGRLS